jgi:hypothetical protein
MSRLKKSLAGKVGYCDNAALGIPKPGGHYVYIREFNGNTCDVNVVTSLEKDGRFRLNRVDKVKKGYVYPIPVRDANFTRWSGVTDNPIKNVPVSKIQDIGKKKIKRRHRFFIGKYLK